LQRLVRIRLTAPAAEKVVKNIRRKTRQTLPAQHRLYSFVVANVGASTLAKLSTRQGLATK
jgi:hypothetical protein